MHVDDVGAKAPEQCAEIPPGPRVEADCPGEAVHEHAGRLAALHQLAAALCRQAELQVSLSPQLPAQQPHLVLAAPPLAAGIDLKDPQGAQAAGVTRPSTLRSSARVNGLWR